MSNINATPLAARAAALHRTRTTERRKVVVEIDTPRRIIRYLYYAFIFSLPFEAADIGTTATPPKLIGVALAAVALLQPQFCYRLPPKAFWCFVMYLIVYTIMGAAVIFGIPEGDVFMFRIIFGFIKLSQLLVLFWISYNLLQHERIVKGALLSLAVSAALLALLQFFGITSSAAGGGRVTAFEQNPNSLATALSLGMLALVGLAFGRGKRDWKAILLFWLGSGILLVAIVQTGSRGAVIALVGALMVFFLKGKSLASKLKLGLVALLGIAVLGLASYQIDAVRARWEKTFYDESLSGREEIFPEAWQMFQEEPLFGWGPVRNYFDLGARRGEPARDPHNLYLWVLTEVGIFGAIPFFAGLWLCLYAAWKARNGVQGVLPLMMLCFVLASNMKGTGINSKLYWVVLAYAVASSSYAVVPTSWKAAASRLARRPMTSGPRQNAGLATPGVASVSSAPSRNT